MKSFQQLQTEISNLTEAPVKSVVFMFGRFNPPTSGHERMVQRAVQVARRAGIREVRLYPSFTQDPKKNPLPHKDKIKWLRKFFGRGVSVIDDSDARTPFAAARKLSDQGYKKVIMVAGGDRIKEFQSQISKYIKHPDPEKSFEFDEFQVLSGGERDPDADNAAGMSASKMREFARLNDLASFAKGLPSNATRTDTSMLFTKLRDSMNLPKKEPILESAQSFIKRLKELAGPDIAEEGKCYAVVWADGRGIASYRNRVDAIKFIEQGDRDVVSVRYQDARLPNGKSLIVRNQFKPDRTSIAEEWPGELEDVDPLIGRVNEKFEQLDEKLRGIAKWWYHGLSGKAVEVMADFHIHQVYREPKSFGFTDDEMLEIAPESGRHWDINPPLEKRLMGQKWALITYLKNIKEISIHALDSQIARKTLKWALNKLDPVPNEVRISTRGQGQMYLSNNTEIEGYLRTGKKIRVSPMAAFR